MIGRRFVIYFAVVMVLLALATALYVRWSLGRAIDHAVQQNLLLARNIARHVGGRLEEDSRALGRLLAALEESPEPEREAALIERTREDLLGRPSIVVLDDAGRVSAGHVESAVGLPPPEQLLPALRRARDRPVVTDLYLGARREARVALVVGAATPATGEGPARWRFAIAAIPLDSDDFLRVFGFFLVGPRAELQLLDEGGSALYSTRGSERYHSAVHGTFFVDKVRLGEPAVMSCHACHLVENEARVAENVVAAVAQVPGTTWAIALLESERDVYATMRELVLTSVGLVLFFFGGFVAFFAVLYRKVLQPMKELARAAAALSSGQTQALPLPLGAADDELGVVARSFESLRQRPAGDPGALGAVLEAPLALPAAPELGELLEAVVLGLSKLDAVRTAGLCVFPAEGGAPRMVARGIELASARPLCEPLDELAKGRRWVPVAELAPAGIEVGDASGAAGLHLRRLSVEGAQRGLLWIGTDGPPGSAGFLGPSVDVLARQVESLLERAGILERIQSENRLRGKLIHRLFEAEEQERRRIARELHDETAQLLTLLLLNVETFPAADAPAKQHEALDGIRQRLTSLLEGIQGLVRRLRPAVLDDLGLVAALRTMGRSMLQPAGVSFEMVIEDDGDQELPKAVEQVVYRVFQEAATNVLRHAKATSVVATLDRSEWGVKASIEDDGTGADVAKLRDERGRPRWGILGMQERVQQLGGTIRFLQSESGGLRIELEIPRST